jgi:hypothetical protein
MEGMHAKSLVPHAAVANNICFGLCRQKRRTQEAQGEREHEGGSSRETKAGVSQSTRTKFTVELFANEILVWAVFCFRGD